MTAMKRFLGVAVCFTATAFVFGTGEANAATACGAKTCGAWAQTGDKTCRTCTTPLCEVRDGKEYIVGMKKEPECEASQGGAISPGVRAPIGPSQMAPPPASPATRPRTVAPGTAPILRRVSEGDQPGQSASGEGSPSSGGEVQERAIPLIITLEPCMAPCPDPNYYRDLTRGCICVPMGPPPTCPAGTTYNAATNTCVTAPPTCPPGTFFNTLTRTCVLVQGPVQSICPAGTILHAATGACVPAQTQPTCSTGTTLCAGTCTNLGDDPHNCGACGFVCQGRQCVKGKCR